MEAVKKQKPTWGDALTALLILAAAALILIALPARGGERLRAVVTVDGETVWSGLLAGLDEPVRYTVEGEYPLTLEISPEGVRVADTACPGKDCLHTGVITRAGQQIVCLPNRTVAALRGSDPAYDAVTG